MPELPEVQTIINDLNKKIKGDTIVDFWSDWPKIIKNLSLEKFKKEIKDREILGARRIGKNIFVDLSGNKTLYIHLKMTGHLLVKPHPNPLLIKEREQNKNLLLYKEKVLRQKVGADEVIKNYFEDRVNQYVHHIWKLKSDLTPSPSPYKGEGGKVFDKTLEFSDLRKFGKIVLVDSDKINNLKEIESLGVDAMSLKFTFGKFQEILSKKKKSPIEIILMDQNLIAGIGNIYRSEILYDAGVLPKRKIQDMKQKERKKIFKAIKKVLKKAIKLRGTSDSDYRDTTGAPGNFQKILKVYRRTGKKCKSCGTIIRRLKMGQRSVFFCPKCQN